MMIARGLLQAGARVVISSRKADTCAKAQHLLSEFGEVRAIPADAVGDRIAAKAPLRRLGRDADMAGIATTASGT